MTIYVDRGENLHRAAVAAGVHVDAACGGNGTCGKCRVLIKKGSARSAPSPKLREDLVEKGYILACLAPVTGDLVVEVPSSDFATAVIEDGTALLARAMKAQEVTLKRKIRIEEPEVDPRVRRYFLEVEPPDLSRVTSDKSRLRRALRESTGPEEIYLPLSVLRTLPHHLRQEGWKVTVTLDRSSGTILDVEPGDSSDENYGLAIDIGTTSVVVYVVDLNTGKIRATASNYNRQIETGDDVISRIVFSLKGDGLRLLQKLIVDTLNDLIHQAAKKASINTRHIYCVFVAGNSTMIHLFLGVSPRYIREEPYVPTANLFPGTTARDLGLRSAPNAAVHCLRGVASYVGADITAGLLASGLTRDEELTLFMDIGTNGELVIGNKDWLVACSCSAGPCFEGGGVTYGTRATAGAIEKVIIDRDGGKPEIQTIGSVPAQGICGSGMIDLLGQLYLSQLIDRRGKFNTELGCSYIRRKGGYYEYLLVPQEESVLGEDIVLTEFDIDNIIRAKAAIYAGITTLLEEVGLSPTDLNRIYIAGGFGRYISVVNAIVIGMFPDVDPQKYYFLGNTAIVGAYMSLLSLNKQRELEKLAKNVTHIELSANVKFMDRYVSSLFLPHTNIEEFPTVERMLSGRQFQP